MGERQGARRPGRAGGGGERPRADRRGRGVRGDQGRARAGRSRCSGTWSGSCRGRRAGAAGARPGRGTPRGGRGAEGHRRPAEPDPDHLHRRAGAARERARGRRADAGRRGGAAGPEAAESTKVATVPWPRNERGALAGLKTTSYGENVVMLAYAHERGAGEAVMANLAGNLCEGTGSNVFYVVDGELRTPTPRERMPGRRDEGTGPRVVRRPGGRRADRRRRAGPARSSSPRRPATCSRSARGTTSSCRSRGRSPRPPGVPRVRARGDDAGDARLMG